MAAGGQEARPAADLDPRQLIDGIRWRTRTRTRTRTDAPWRDLPERYGPRDRAYDLFRRWQRDGTWTRVFEQLQAETDAMGLIAWDVSVGSTIARPPACKGDLRKEPPGASTPSPTTTVSGARTAG